MFSSNCLPLIHPLFARPLVMAAAYYDMQGLEADDIEKCLPTAQFHYDLIELDFDCPAGYPWTSAAYMEPAYMEPPPLQFDEPPDAPDVLGDGSLWFYVQPEADLGLLQIATSLVAFFGEPAALIASVKCHKIHAIFSLTCAVKVQLYRTPSAYLLEIADRGSDEALFFDILWQATAFLMSCGCYVWDAV